MCTRSKVMGEYILIGLLTRASDKLKGNNDVVSFFLCVFVSFICVLFLVLVYHGLGSSWAGHLKKETNCLTSCFLKISLQQSVSAYKHHRLSRIWNIINTRTVPYTEFWINIPCVV